MNEFFKMLRKDHRTVKTLLSELEETESKSKKREELFKTLKEELVPHMKAEESTFYDALVGKKSSRDKGLEGFEEHHVAEMVLKELDSTPKDEDKWKAKLSVFKEIVEHHIREEQGAMFNAAEEALTEKQLESIMKDFQEKKKSVKEKMK